jgi:hypothetical protein
LLTHILSFTELLQRARNEGQSEPDTEVDDSEPSNNIDNDIFGNTESDPEDGKHTSTTVNDPTEDLHPGSPTLDAPLSDEISDIEMDLPGARLRTCISDLERLHQLQVANGKKPEWPFADYLEFEFVQWMVVNDISQTARDKLIKLPIVSYINKNK